MQDLQSQIHGIVDREGPDQTDEGQVADAGDQRHAPPEAVGDEADDGQHQQSPHAVQGAGERAEPILATQVELEIYNLL